MARVQLRRDTAANWTAANPVLGIGEPAYETDTKKRKTGDGATAWTALAYDGADKADASALAAKADAAAVSSALTAKADVSALASKLSVGNIKTVNGQSLVGTGDLAIAGTGGGASAPTRVAAASVIPLDDAVAGKAMPLVAGQQVAITSPTTITVGPSPVDGGTCVVDYRLSAALDLSNCIAKGEALAVGNNARVTYEYSAVEGKPFAYVALGSALPSAAPGAPTLALGAGTATTQAFTITAPATDASHGAAITYTILESLDGGATYSPAYNGNSLTPTVNGVTQAALFQATATNATGTGPVSNVVSVAGGALSIVDTGTGNDAVNLTTLSTGGWRKYEETTNYAACANAAGFANIAEPQYVNGKRVTGGAGGGGVVTYSDNANQYGPTDGSNRNSTGAFASSGDGSVAGSVYWTIPAPTVPGTKVRVRVYNYFTNSYYVKGSLSDNSAAPVSLQIPQQQWRDFDISYCAKTAGQTLRLELGWPAGAPTGGGCVQFIAVHG